MGIESASPTQKLKTTSSAAAEERREIRARREDHLVGVVADLGPSAELHRHARAELHVHHLVEREAARHRDEIERRAALDDAAQGLGARGAGAVLLEGRARPSACRAAITRCSGCSRGSSVPHGMSSTSGRILR
jgi:hypothetical protein